MLAEFVESIRDLGSKARKVEFFTHPELLGKVFVRDGDKLTVHDMPPPRRLPRIGSYHDLVEALKDPVVAPRPEVYVCPTGVSAFLDREGRRDVLVVELETTAQFDLCAELETPRKMQPRDLVKLLTLELYGAGHEHVAQAYRSVEFTRTTSGKTAIGPASESLGRSVEAMVKQADIPLRFEVVVPVWTTTGFAGYTAVVEFGVHLVHEESVLEVRTLSDSCARARNSAVARMIEDLRGALGEDVPVFFGVP
jgi:hypothetical protein